MYATRSHITNVILLTHAILAQNLLKQYTTYLRNVKRFQSTGTYVNNAVKDVKDQNLRYRLQADFIITRRGGSGQVSAALRRPFTPLNLIMATSVSRTLPGFTSLYIVLRYYGSFASASKSFGR